MSDNLSPLSNSTSALLESWIWSERAYLIWSQNCGLMEKPQPWLFLQSTFPHTDADIIAHLLFVFVIHTRQQVKHEMNSYRLQSVHDSHEFLDF